MRLNSDYEQKE